VNIEVVTATDMEALGYTLGALAKAGDILVLTGELGAGKTTFTRGFGEALDLVTPVSSPTFIVARTHARKNPGAADFVHIDAYRLGSEAELEDLDIDVDSSIVVAEWAAPYASALSGSWLEIILQRPTAALLSEDGEDEPRTVTFIVHGPDQERYQRFVEAASGH
jgi:tRNA threonylcarbamoyladenosine biosynthesis protein TsaE